ncbi:carboxypeptidase-like regulatory domain-containing protein [Rhodocaloribacter sp.]
MIRILLALFIGTAGAPGAFGQAVVFGRAADLDTGAPLAWVRVTLEAPDAAAARAAWTDTAGRYALTEVPAGRWRIRADYVSGTRRVSVLSPAFTLSEAVTTLNFELPSDPKEWLGAPDSSPFRTKNLGDITGIPREGRILDAAGHALPGVRSVVERLAAGLVRGLVTEAGRPVPEAVVRLGDAREAVTDTDGRFFLEAVPPGRYELHVFRENARLDATAVDIRPGENVFHLDLTRRP